MGTVNNLYVSNFFECVKNSISSEKDVVHGKLFLGIDIVLY
jgi:hypothetical protein